MQGSGDQRQRREAESNYQSKCLNTSVESKPEDQRPESKQSGKGRFCKILEVKQQKDLHSIQQGRDQSR